MSTRKHGINVQYLYDIAIRKREDSEKWDVCHTYKKCNFAFSKKHSSILETGIEQSESSCYSTKTFFVYELNFNACKDKYSLQMLNVSLNNWKWDETGTKWK